MSVFIKVDWRVCGSTEREQYIGPFRDEYAAQRFGDSFIGSRESIPWSVEQMTSVDDARKQFSDESPPTQKGGVRMEYLLVWVEDSSGDYIVEALCADRDEVKANRHLSGVLVYSLDTMEIVQGDWWLFPWERREGSYARGKQRDNFKLGKVLDPPSKDYERGFFR